MSDDSMFGWLKEKLNQKSASPPAEISSESSESLPIPTIADVLILPDVERKLINWLVRQQQATLNEIAAYIAHDEESTQSILAELGRKGFIAFTIDNEQCCYAPRLRSRRSS